MMTAFGFAPRSHFGQLHVLDIPTISPLLALFIRIINAIYIELKYRTKKYNRKTDCFVRLFLPLDDDQIDCIFQHSPSIIKMCTATNTQLWNGLEII